MNAAARKIQRIYLTLTLGNTLAASFIWGVNTLFLLDAGLTNFEAFAANAFFTAARLGWRAKDLRIERRVREVIAVRLWAFVAVAGWRTRLAATRRVARRVCFT